MRTGTVLAILVAFLFASPLAAADKSSSQARQIGRLASDLILCDNALAENSSPDYLDIQHPLTKLVEDDEGKLPHEFFEGMRESREVLRDDSRGRHEDPALALKRRFTPAFCADALAEAKRAVAGARAAGKSR